VSVVTIGELQLGVLSAQDAASRARRADTLALARTADPIRISEAIMISWARLVADCRAAGIHCRSTACEDVRCGANHHHQNSL
jgi:predicted nucleic acid-binding protein